MECNIAFDSFLVELVSVEEGELFVESPFISFFSWELTAPDSASVFDCVLGYRSYILTPGEICRFVFKARQPGSCAVRFSSVKLWDIDRVETSVVADPSAWIFIGGPVAAGTACAGDGYLKCYPNPFNPSTSLLLRLPPARDAEDQHRLSVVVYSASGRRVKLLYAGPVGGTKSRFEWDGTDEYGDPVASGVYFAVVKTQQDLFRTKLVLVR
jgi:hypothetical protein